MNKSDKARTRQDKPHPAAIGYLKEQDKAILLSVSRKKNGDLSDQNSYIIEKSGDFFFTNI